MVSIGSTRAFRCNLVLVTVGVSLAALLINASKYVAYIIDTLNHDSSISDLLNPNERIQNIVARYKNGEL